MTAIFYPDCRATSPCGTFVLEARSPHNGTIPRRDGHSATDADYGFKYRSHQHEFRYRLLAFPGDPSEAGGGRGRVVWERWQDKGEDSPHELVVADDGWSAIRTHGFRPEVIVVSPTGHDTVRVRIADATDDEDAEVDPSDTRPASGTVPNLSWPAKHLSHSTAGSYWAGHSWPYFLRWAGNPYFVWRTYWGDRLVIDLAHAAIASLAGDPTAAFREAMDEEEKQGVLALLTDLSGHLPEVEGLVARRRSGEDDEEGELEPWREKLRRVTSALHLAGIHRVRDAIPHLRGWEPVDCPSYSTGTTAFGRGWWVQVQHFRPILRQSLRLLGEQPRGFPAYYFQQTPDKVRLAVAERPGVAHEQAAGLRDTLSTHEVLDLLGTPDHILRRSHPVGRGLYKWTEEWEYDSLLAGRWITLRITWEEAGRVGRIGRVEEVGPYWLEDDSRATELLSH